ncbi:MAG TPA: site-specific DNA-methyltransferase [Candidatus Limnocylindria bacterium]|nr:site-specific DNA-methyltransferase [Candidatus Limnocylindria bacterium]
MDWLRNFPDASIDLAVTSPPFPLLRQKAYGNKTEDDYLEWLLGFSRGLKAKLKPTGSFVVDLGGAYQRGTPTRSLVQWKFVIRMVEDLGYSLAQECYWNNPSKLPSPFEWVNKRKLRLKDPVNTVWWFGQTAWPKADTRRVLVPYSDRMQKLLLNPEAYYTAADRPSQHYVSWNFKDNGGALPSHLLTIPNSESNGTYLRACKVAGAKPHPARFPEGLPEFFIKLLTDPGDLVVDLFAGSNTTGAVAEKLGRRWMACDLDRSYVAASALRFVQDLSRCTYIYERLMSGDSFDLMEPTARQAG